MNIPKKSIWMFTCVCTCVYVHEQISIQRHSSTMGNHNDYVQFVEFVSMLKQPWSPVFTSLNQIVHLRSKRGPNVIFHCLWKLWFPTSQYKCVCIYAWNKVNRVSFYVLFIFIFYIVFKCISVGLCLRNCYLCFDFFAQFTKGVDYSWFLAESLAVLAVSPESPRADDSQHNSVYKAINL